MSIGDVIASSPMVSEKPVHALGLLHVAVAWVDGSIHPNAVGTCVYVAARADAAQSVRTATRIWKAVFRPTDVVLRSPSRATESPGAQAADAKAERSISCCQDVSRHGRIPLVTDVTRRAVTGNRLDLSDE